MGLRRLLRSLRVRLVISHVLPLLVVLPLVGVALAYLLETQVLLAERSHELELQAALVAAAATDNLSIWVNARAAQEFVERIGQRVTGRAMLVANDGTLLAASDPADQKRLGQRADFPGLKEALGTGRAVRVDYNRQAGTAEAVVPVWVGGRVLGAIRLTDPLASVYQRFPHARTLIMGVLAGGLLLGLAIGGALAYDVARPLAGATRAIDDMVAGKPLSPLREQGPEEIHSLLHAFNTLTAQLQAMERARRQLLANLVHELGRPLGALLSAAQALAAGADREPELRRELVEGMEGEVQRLQRLLDDLTSLYSQTRGATVLQRCPIDLCAWLPPTLGPWREAAQSAGLQWRQELPEALPPVSIDPDRMGQALGNVLANAIKYTPAGGWVVVSAAVEKAEVVLRVADSGPGIAPEERERIFAPFYRGAVGGRFPQGMGLGLSIAHEVLVAHGGRIAVQDSSGQGATLALHIPVLSQP